MKMLKTNAMIGVATAALSLSPLAGMAADVQAAVASIMPQQQTKSMHVRVSFVMLRVNHLLV